MRLSAGRSDEREPDPRDGGDDTPETPPDEPQPAPVQDPPVEPVEPPYVVRGFPGRAGAATRVET
jgi:hypothetical protein